MFSQFWANQAHIKSLYTDCIEPVCQKYNLTRMELDILLFLANNPQFTTATEIIEMRRLTKSHVSLAVNTLTEKGYLTKNKSTQNRKTIHLSLCPLADQIIQDGQAAQQAFGSILFQGFTPEDYQQILRFFGQINQNVKNYKEGRM